jgi:hypothetical protein
MKLLFIVNLMFSMACFAGGTDKVDLGEFENTVHYIDLNDSSPDKIVVNFTLKYKTRECVNRQFAMSDGHLVSLGCPFYLYTPHLNPEDLVIDIEKSSAVAKLQNQKIKVEIFQTEKYGPDYDARVTIVSGSDDTVKKGKTFFSRNNKFTIIAKEISVAVVDSNESLKSDTAVSSSERKTKKAIAN